jgi:predicted 3-demethylubiquinone-9 3-methyltransferase (glyoxalase superfamily)
MTLDQVRPCVDDRAPYFHDSVLAEAISFLVNCEGQEEVDELWAALSEGGEEGPCGWLKDRYGVSWQIIPSALPQLMGDSDPEKAQRVMKAMLEMKKIDIEGLSRAHDGP